VGPCRARLANPQGSRHVIESAVRALPGYYSDVTQLRALLVLGLIIGIAGSQSRTISQVLVSVTSPAEEFGASIGDDYFLATYQQLERYWQKLDTESDRVRLVSIGRTEEGRDQWMAAGSASARRRRSCDRAAAWRACETS
jgi:hypothetical protein